jgi:hypothetical protein
MDCKTYAQNVIDQLGEAEARLAYEVDDSILTERVDDMLNGEELEVIDNLSDDCCAHYKVDVDPGTLPKYVFPESASAFSARLRAALAAEGVQAAFRFLMRQQNPTH